MDLTDLPTLNAVLNSIAATLLACGYVLIRRRRIEAHRACMLAACGTSTLFLISYLVYHANVGSVPYTGQGLARTVYFAILVSHIVLAALILPLALTTARPRPARAVRAAPPHRPLDAAHLALRLGHGRGRLRHALSAVNDH